MESDVRSKQQVYKVMEMMVSAYCLFVMLWLNILWWCSTKNEGIAYAELLTEFMKLTDECNLYCVSSNAISKSRRNE